MNIFIFPKAKAPGANHRIGWLLALLILLCFPIIYFVQKMTSIETMVFILTGYIVVIFGLYFWLTAQNNGRARKGRHLVKTHFGFEYEKNNKDLSGMVKDIPVAIKYNIVFSESTNYETYVTTYGTKITNTHILVGQNLEASPPNQFKKQGISLKNNVWHWQGKKDVLDDPENVIGLIEAMVEEVLNNKS